MSTRTRARKAARKAAKVSTKYDLCCLSVMPFSYPAAPYRVYVADRSSGGLIVSRFEAGAFGSRAEAERWLNQNCRSWRLCDSP